jgi:amino acid transporter
MAARIERQNTGRAELFGGERLIPGHALQHNTPHAGSGAASAVSAHTDTDSGSDRAMPLPSLTDKARVPNTRRRNHRRNCSRWADELDADVELSLRSAEHSRFGMPAHVIDGIDLSKSNQEVSMTHDKSGDGIAMSQIPSKLTGSSSASSDAALPGAGSAKPALAMSTMMGVYLPVVQNILGTLLFLRLSWITGQAGWGLSLLIVVISLTCTYLTTLSMSAVVTNGKVAGGGPYFLISRNLGPTVGASVGLCFYLGTVCGVALYVLGAVEAFLETVGDSAEFAGGFTTQIYAEILVALLALVVYLGINYVAYFGSAALVCVFLGIFSVFLGFFVLGTDTAVYEESDGLKVSTLNDNFEADMDPDVTFAALLALFFPSVTGIMAGSNRSAALANPGRSIPLGTLGAITTTGALYIVWILFFGAGFARDILIGDKFLVPQLGFPSAYISKVAVILSSIGAGLQSLAGAPLLLHAIASDLAAEIPMFRRIARDEPASPRAAVLFSYTLVALLVLLGNIDAVAPILTMFFLICYATMNFSCFLSTVLKRPSWRPEWKYFHWSTALLGTILCVVLMFWISWYSALGAIVLAFGIARYVEYMGVSRDWGDGLRGLKYNMAVRNVLELRSNADQDLHANNWRPQFLLMYRVQQKRPELSDVEQEELAREAGQQSHLESSVTLLKFLSFFRMSKSLMHVVGVTECTGDLGSARDQDQDQDEEDEDDYDTEHDESALSELNSGHDDILQHGTDGNDTDADDGDYAEAVDQVADLEHKQGSALADESMNQSMRHLNAANKNRYGHASTSNLHVSSDLHRNHPRGAATPAHESHVAQHHEDEQYLNALIQQHKVPALAKIVCSSAPAATIAPVLLQSVGAGVLSPNLVLLAWPFQWETNWQDREFFLSTLRASHDYKKAIMVCMNAERFGTILTELQEEQQAIARGHKPKKAATTKSTSDTLDGKVLSADTGVHDPNRPPTAAHVGSIELPHAPIGTSRDSGRTIDVWWQRADGGMMLLLARLLQRNATLKSCRLRLFTTAGEYENSIAIRQYLVQYLKQVRISATVTVVEMVGPAANSHTVVPYAVQRTLEMEQRHEMLRQLNELRESGDTSSLDSANGTVRIADKKFGKRLADLSEVARHFRLLHSAPDTGSLDGNAGAGAGTDSDTSDIHAAHEHQGSTTPRLGEVNEHHEPFEAAHSPIRAHENSDSVPSVMSVFPGAFDDQESTSNRCMPAEIPEEQVSNVPSVMSIFPDAFDSNQLSDDDEKRDKITMLPSNVHDEKEDQEVVGVGVGDGDGDGDGDDDDDDDGGDLDRSAMDRSVLEKVQVKAKKMALALQYHNHIKEHSNNAALIITNLPYLNVYRTDAEFLSFTEALTQDLPQMLLVRGSQQELIDSFM